MNDPRPVLKALRRALAKPDRGVLGLVDELLMASREQDIRLGWQDGNCLVSAQMIDPWDRIEVPLRKSVVRAALARIAALCNERSRGSVSPYGGQGELTIEADSPTTIHVRFVNTRETLCLELSSVPAEVVSLTKLSPIQPTI